MLQNGVNLFDNKKLFCYNNITKYEQTFDKNARATAQRRKKMYTVTYIGCNGGLIQEQAETLFEARKIARSQRFGFMSIKDVNGYEIYNIIRENYCNGCLEFALVCKE